MRNVDFVPETRAWAQIEGLDKPNKLHKRTHALKCHLHGIKCRVRCVAVVFNLASRSFSALRRGRFRLRRGRFQFFFFFFFFFLGRGPSPRYGESCARPPGPSRAVWCGSAKSQNGRVPQVTIAAAIYVGEARRAGRGWDGRRAGRRPGRGQASRQAGRSGGAAASAALPRPA